MSRLIRGAICGIVFGIVDVLLMMPIEFGPERSKALAMAGAFFNCFSIGLVIGAARLPLAGWAAGLIFGVVISIPDAMITGSYIPILPIAALGGAVIGWVVDREKK